MSDEKPECAACGQPACGDYSIHRDGFGEGPEVPICADCGGSETPSLEAIWKRIRVRRYWEAQVR